eukprot:g31019.t1
MYRDKTNYSRIMLWREISLRVNLGGCPKKLTYFGMRTGRSQSGVRHRSSIFDAVIKDFTRTGDFFKDGLERLFCHYSSSSSSYLLYILLKFNQNNKRK